MIEKFVDKLRSEVRVDKDEAYALAGKMAAAISRTPAKSRYRSDEEIVNSVVRGFICELGVAQILGKRNEKDWSYKDRESFAYDVIDTDHFARHEVKHQHGDHWSFRPEAIKTLLNNIAAGLLDTIITADYRSADDGFYVKPILIIDPKHFRSYMRRSQYKPGTFYYDHRAASHDKHCIILEKV